MNSEQKNLFRKYKIHPIKRLGQNFLTDKKAVEKIINAAEIKPRETVLEIGPGLGALTKKLAKKAKKVIAVEKDPKMAAILKETLRDCKNIEIVNEDILKFNTRRKIQDTRYKVVGSLPFYLTAPIIRRFLENAGVQPPQMTVVVQKEVGERICVSQRTGSSNKTKKKNPKMSLLAVSVQFYAEPKIMGYISKKSFWPQPKVDSAILRIDPKIKKDKKTDRQKFFQVVKTGFSQPRKQLINNLSKGMNLSREKVEKWLLENNIRPVQRAESLSVNDWEKLIKGMP